MYPTKVASKLRNESVLEQILNTLANEDARKILFAADEGIRRSTKTMKELGMTRKRYYTRLSALVDAGLVEKNEAGYQHTLLGKICHKLLLELLGAIEHEDRLILTDQLLQSDTLSVQEKKGILRAISGQGLERAAFLAEIIPDVQTIISYDAFIDEVIRLLNATQEIAYVATNKIDLRVKDAMINVINRDAQFFALSTESSPSENLELLRMIMNPAAIQLIRRLVTSQDLNIRVVKDLAYCFVVADGTHGLIELPHPSSRDFYVAFRFTSELFCQRLIDVFTTLYDEGKEDPRIKFAKKTLGIL